LGKGEVREGRGNGREGKGRAPGKGFGNIGIGGWMLGVMDESSIRLKVIHEELILLVMMATVANNTPFTVRQITIIFLPFPF
jgi:hypothetical protein